MTSLISSDLSPAIQRILVWCSLGCTLAREGGRWRLERPADMRPDIGPAPTAIQDRTAQAAIKLGARVHTSTDLFGGEMARAA